MTIFAAFLTLAGCSGGGPTDLTPGPATGGTIRTLEADWNDVEAAVDIAMSEAETAVVTTNDASDWFALYDFGLITIDDRRGTLVASRLNPPPAPTKSSTDDLATAAVRGPEPIRFFCRIGPQGDQNREDLILSSVERRLRQLRGRGAAAIPNETFAIKPK